MWKQLDIRQRYEKRIYLFVFMLVLMFLLLLGRMLQLQWVQYSEHYMQAENNRVHISPMLPTRGEMVDRFGVGLAVNKQSYKVTVVPDRVENISSTLHALQALMHWSDKKLNKLSKLVRKSRSDRAVLLADQLPWSAVVALAARLHHFPGVNVVTGTHRYYPYALETSHLIGYLSLARDVDIKAGYLRMEYVGRSGLERILETRLHGNRGYEYVEVDATGRRVSLLRTEQANIGANIQLSLDIELQQAAAKALAGRTGAVVVMDVDTGEVLTLLSQPGYDSNKFITGLKTAQWQAWLNNEERPLLNRVMQAAYPPASTLKIVTSFAGLAEDIKLASGSTQCAGYIKLADRKIRCWKKRGHGKVDMHDALVHSCDVYYYEMGDALGMERLVREASRWGFGERTGIRLPPESRGNLPKAQPGQGRKRWFRGETMITAIGQGAVTVTPLQMARFTAAVANGGAILTPLLEKGEPVKVVRQLDIKPSHLQVVRQAMRDVVAKRTGTAHRALGGALVAVAGKTGTAQVVKMADDEKRTFSNAKIHQDHAWFMGYAPYDNPKIAIAVFVEHGGHGGSDAAPVARAIVDAWARKQVVQ